jgi:hypothetical protein
MFVRRKPDKTGTVSVHVNSRKRGLNKLIQSFGVGRTEIETACLEEQARQFIRARQGLTGELFENEDELKLESFIFSLSGNQLQVIGPELISGCLYDRTGYGAINQDI